MTDKETNALEIDVERLFDEFIDRLLTMDDVDYESAGDVNRIKDHLQYLNPSEAFEEALGWNTSGD